MAVWRMGMKGDRQAPEVGGRGNGYGNLSRVLEAQMYCNNNDHHRTASSSIYGCLCRRLKRNVVKPIDIDMERRQGCAS